MKKVVVIYKVNKKVTKVEVAKVEVKATKVKKATIIKDNKKAKSKIKV